MNYLEHEQTALAFLDEADADFDAGKPLKACEMMAGAAAHAVMAVAQQRGWRFSKHQHRVYAVRRLRSALPDEDAKQRIKDMFQSAARLHANFYHGTMSPEHIEHDRAEARRFVYRILAMMT